VSEPAGPETTPTPRRGDRALLVLFWTWAAVLVVATIAQLFRIEPILDVLDVKNWFAR
jgi:hypothetical protein